jgi:hypothetical protein
MTFVVPAEALNNVCREVVISTKENEPGENISHTTFLQSFSVHSSYPDEPGNPNLDIGLFPQLHELQRAAPPSPLRPSLVKSFSTGFGHKDSSEAGEQARNSTSVSSTTETKYQLHDVQPRYGLAITTTGKPRVPQFSANNKTEVDSSEP